MTSMRPTLSYVTRYLGGKWTIWSLHAAVRALAVASILSGRFDAWIDLRQLGWGGPFLEILWVGTAVLVPWCAGPRIAGWLPGRRAQWIEGYLPRLAKWLLIPTYLILACLVANSAYYFVLLVHDDVDAMVPLPLVAALVLGAWVLLVRQWVRQSPRESGRLTRLGQVATAGLATLIWILTLGFFLVHDYRKPPAGPVDLAVVLGTGVRPDGTATHALADRVQVAIELFRRGQVKHILLSGAIYPDAAGGSHEISEVAAMLKVCLAADVPVDAVSLDPVGVNTKATAFNTREFMRAHEYSTVVACSTDFHLYRTALSFRQVGVQADVLPAQPENWICANPRETLRELAGIVVYELNPHYREAKGMEMQLNEPRVIVRKTAGSLEVFDGPQLVKTYACITGGSPGDKSIEGDRKTPVGSFRIVYKNPLSKFHLSLGLDYPNREDAQRGLAAGLISQTEYDGILQALQSDLSREENQDKLWHTPLGGEIFIHGHGEGRTGTAGCIALKNSDVDELYAILPVGTSVEIRP